MRETTIFNGYVSGDVLHCLHSNIPKKVNLMQDLHRSGAPEFYRNFLGSLGKCLICKL